MIETSKQLLLLQNMDPLQHIQDFEKRWRLWTSWKLWTSWRLCLHYKWLSIPTFWDEGFHVGNANISHITINTYSEKGSGHHAENW